MESFAVCSTSSESAGSSYGAETPVKSLILPSRALVVSFGIALLANFYRAAAVDLQEIAGQQQSARPLPVAAKRRHERRQHDRARLDEDLGEFSNPPDVFRAVSFREAKVAAEAVPDIVPIEHERAAPHPVQPLLGRVRNGGLAGTGQAGEPKHDATVPMKFFPALTRDGGVMPDDVGTRLAHVQGRAFR